MSTLPPSSGVLLVTAVPLMQANGKLFLDDQTCDGLGRWVENFGRVAYTGIATGEGPGDSANLTESTVTWRDVRDLPFADRVQFTAFPPSYKMLNFARNYGAARRSLGQKIKDNRYLCFTLGALVGDWGAIASLEAIRQKRRYAVSFDRVEYEVIRNTLGIMPLRRRLKERVTIPWMAHYHHYLTRKSALGLFQGQDCFQALGRFAEQAFPVYDTHTQPSDRICTETLQNKCHRVRSGVPLRIVYAGRASEMKGPIDWLRTVAHARRGGVAMSAVWLGDGPMLEPMRREAERLGISDCVSFAGFIANREKVLSVMRDSDLYLFCHKTPESPRCLVEALVSGTPIIGFDSPYPRALIQANGGGRLVEAGDVEALAAVISALDTDRFQLADLISRSAQDGERFDEESLYRERGDLLKAFL